MHELDQKTRDYARINAAAIMRGIQIVGQAPLADAIGTTQPTIHRFVSGEGHINAETVALMLATMGLRVVDQDAKTVDYAEWSSVLELASRWIGKLREGA